MGEDGMQKLGLHSDELWRFKKRDKKMRPSDMTMEKMMC